MTDLSDKEIDERLAGELIKLAEKSKQACYDMRTKHGIDAQIFIAEELADLVLKKEKRKSCHE